MEKDDVGWDLEVENRDLKLKIEVKGLSGGKIMIDLTPNEYANMQKYKGSYRIAVVTKCVQAPELNIYFYIKEEQRWGDEKGNRLNIKVIEVSRISLKFYNLWR